MKPELEVWQRREYRKRLYAIQRGLCALCNQPMLPVEFTGAVKPDAATFDHILAKSKGGRWTPSNLRLAHKRCNTERGNK